MSRVPWHLFQDRQPRAHLVVGVVAQAEGPVGGDELNAVQNLLSRLVRQQKLGGDYAATVVRETGRPEVYFAFVDEADARKFGDTVQAETTDTLLRLGERACIRLAQRETGKSRSLASGAQR